ncbi:MAG: septal ring lytic transglycosylase RlpA family protein [Steroidobacteraceae bacterium]
MRVRRVAGLVAALVLAGCASLPREQPPARAPERPTPPPPPTDLAGIPDAVPRAEPRSRYGNPVSYEVFGKRYYVLATSEGYVERGTASWYGPGFHAERTSSGEPYDMYAMTAAHKTLPIPVYARVTNLRNGRSVVVRINDRGPFVGDRIIDLSYTAAWKLDMLREGTAPVELRVLPAGPAPAPTLTAQATMQATPTPTATTAAVTGGAPQSAVAAAEPVSMSAPTVATAAAGTLAPAAATSAAAPPVTSASGDAPLAASPALAASSAPAASATSAAPAVPAAPAGTQGSMTATADSTVMAPRAISPAGAGPSQPATAQWVQAGAFSSEANARALITRLATAGLSAVELREAVVAGRPLWRVCLGPIADRLEIDDVLERLRLAGVSGARLVAD